MPILALAAAVSLIKLRESDAAFQYGKRYHYFGVFAPPGIEVANPQPLFSRMSQMVGYCRTNKWVPVAVFYWDNQELNQWLKNLGVLTICLEANGGGYVKTVTDGRTEWPGLSTVYGVTDTEALPPPLQEVVDKDNTVIRIDGRVPAPAGVRRVSIDPAKQVADARPERKVYPDGYAAFPLGEPVRDILEPTMPLELPPALMGVQDQARQDSAARLDNLRNQHR